MKKVWTRCFAENIIEWLRITHPVAYELRYSELHCRNALLSESGEEVQLNDMNVSEQKEDGPSEKDDD